MSDFKPGSLDELIEADIDRFGLQHTVQRLELICAEKAAHIATNSTDILDKKLALNWKLFSVRLKRVSQLAAELLP